MFLNSFFFKKNYFIFKLYKIVLVMPYIIIYESTTGIHVNSNFLLWFGSQVESAGAHQAIWEERKGDMTILINCFDWESPPAELGDRRECWSRAAEQSRCLPVKHSAAISRSWASWPSMQGRSRPPLYSGSNGGLQVENAPSVIYLEEISVSWMVVKLIPLF